MTYWTVQPWEDGLSLQELFRLRLPTLPDGYFRRLVKSGKLRSQATALEPTTVLREGDRIALPHTQRLGRIIETAPIAPEAILWEEPQLIVIFKPAGTPTHAGQQDERRDLTSRLREFFNHRKAPFSVAPAHRLDKDTSGPVLFAKGKKAAAMLGKMLENSTIKSYLALTDGAPERKRGTICLPLLHRGTLRPCRTDYRVLAANAQCALLELQLHSGRRHQIRRHLSLCGVPIIGDKRYNEKVATKTHRMMLHAHRLSFPSLDRANHQIDIRVPPPEAFLKMAYELGIDTGSLTEHNDHLSSCKSSENERKQTP